VLGKFILLKFTYNIFKHSLVFFVLKFYNSIHIKHWNSICISALCHICRVCTFSSNLLHSISCFFIKNHNLKDSAILMEWKLLFPQVN